MTDVHKPSPDASDEALTALRERLRELQLPQIVHRRRAIILFEGPDGAGKKRALRELASAFDPCHYNVHTVGYDRRQAADGHWLARFWRALPSSGDTAIFFRSWYRRVLDDRILGRTDEAALTRAFDEINEFEAQQRDYGTLTVKLYFDVSADVQDARLKLRAADPWHSVLRGEDSISVRDLSYLKAVEDMKRHTNTRWSPWCVMDGDDDGEAAIAALTAIAGAWEKAMPSEPPHLVRAPNRAA